MLNMVKKDIKNNGEKINNLFNDYNNNSNIKYKNNINIDKNNINKNNNTNLIKNIKSNDVYQNLFSYMNEKRKLKLIKYNNNLKSKIDITLNNYKFYNKKYII